MIDKRVSFLVPDQEPYTTPALRNARKEVWKLFSRLGFAVEPASMPLADPLTFGLFVPQRKKDFYDQVSHLSGIPRPRQLSVAEMMDSKEPVVAKNLDKHKGQGKYLIETYEQRLRLAALAMMDDPSQTSADPYVLRTLLEVVEFQGITEDMVSHKFKNRWAIEEFVDGPTEHFTSLRLVVDGVGNVHYGEVLYSRYKKAENVRQQGANTVLDDPDSPLFLNSCFIQSNFARGGQSILLDGKPKPQEERGILGDLGIDPERPTVPDELIQAVRRTATLLKDVFPYWGFDFLPTQSGSYVMPEVQIPGLNKAALGLPDNNRAPALVLCERIGREILRRHALRSG